MPQKRSSAPPPPVMTWSKATPVIVVAVIFDATRFMFEQFWLFGPALAGIYCTSKASAVVGAAVGGSLCGVTAVAAGVVGAAAIETFGIVMAIVLGLFGWLTIGFWLMVTNGRIFKENSGNLLWFGGSLLVSEVPFIGSLPALTATTAKMYSTQIKMDREKMRAYQEEQAAAQLQEQQQQAAQFMQARNAQMAQAMQMEAQEAANEESYEEEIPEELRNAA